MYARIHVALTLWILLTAAAVAEDWPRWRGPRGDGIAPAQPHPMEWDEETNIRWRVDVPGRSHGSPIVVGDAIYLTTATDDTEQQSVVCLNRKDGSKRWATVLHEGDFPPLDQLHVKASNGNGTIACSGDQLFIAFLNDGKIHATALDLNGDILWQREIGPYHLWWGYGPSPIVYESTVIFVSESLAGGFLTALDLRTGEEVWRQPRGEFVTYSSPVLAHVGGRTQLLLSGGEAITSYDPDTGEEQWRTPCGWKSTVGTVVAAGDRLYASGGYPTAQTICLSGDGELVWENQIQIYEPSMLIVEGDLLGIRDDGVAFLWDGDTGDEKWKKRITRDVSASPVMCDGRILIVDRSGESIIFRISDTGPEILARNRLGEECCTSHSLSDGEIFLRVAYGKGDHRREQVVCIADR